MILIKRTSQFIIWLMAVCAVVIFMVPLLFWGGVTWLQTTKGQEFLRTTLEQQIKSRGYEAKITGFKYEYPLSLHMDSIDISVKDNPDIDVKDIKLNVNLHSFFAGKLDAIGFYKKKKISLKANATWKIHGFDFKNITISAPDFNAVGNLFVNKISSIMTGNISGKLGSLSSYKNVIGGQHELKNIDFNVSLGKEAGRQGISINLQIPEYRNENIGVILSGIDIKTNILKQTNGYKISGEIAPKKINIQLPETFVQLVPQVNIVTSHTNTRKADNNIKLDILVNAPDKIFVRGWGLDAEFGGKLAITGVSNDPKFNGSFNMLRGRYNEFGKSFKIVKANLNFLGSVPPSPDIDILAETKAGDKIAQISITGPALKPKIGFSSKPPMPEDEVLSYILFGDGVETISPFQALQLAQTLQRFSGQASSSFDPIGRLQSTTGLDNLYFDTDENGGTTIGAGKYISDNVYLELEAGSIEGSSNATIEIELTPNITLESEIGQGAHSGAGIFWKHDY